MPIFWAVLAKASAGTMALRISVVMSHSFSCSAPKSTTTRLDCELKDDGTWSSRSLTMSCTRAGVRLAPRSLLSG